MKYYNYQITFSEVPDETTLCINLSNCPIHCPNCHSKWLWEDIGRELTFDELKYIIARNPGITCICFMGGDGDYSGLQNVVCYAIVINDMLHRECKYAVYSGRENLHEFIQLAGLWVDVLNFIKVGSYKKKFGGLNSKITNQRFYYMNHDSSTVLDDQQGMIFTGYDWTYKFWNNNQVSITQLEE